MLSVSLVISMTTAAFANTDNINTGRTSNCSQTVDFGEGQVTFHYYQVGNKRYTEYVENSKNNIVEYDTDTNVLKLNGEIVQTSMVETTSSFQDSSITPYKVYKNTWKYYESSENSMGIIGFTAVTVAAMIASAMGIVVTTAIKAAVNTAVRAALSSISYVKTGCYIDPVTTSRPIIAHQYDFYKGRVNSELLASFDNRY